MALPAVAQRVVALAVLLAALAACGSSSGGGSGSSESSNTGKPAYCADKANLKSAVGGLKDVDVRANGTQALKTQLQKVDSAARALSASAKGAYSNATKAVSASVDQLKSRVAAISSPPTRQQLAALGTDVAGAAAAVTSFDVASHKKC